jgi:hypothetical protein
MTSLSRLTPPAASEHLTELIGCPISCPSPLPALILNQGSFPPPALLGFYGTTSLSVTPWRPDHPHGRPVDRPRPRHGASRVARVVLVYMLSPLPRHSDGRYYLAHSVPSYQPSPIGLSGRPVHRPFRGLLSVHSRYGLHTRAATVFCGPLIPGGFSDFVASAAAPVASGGSTSPGGAFTHWNNTALSRRTPKAVCLRAGADANQACSFDAWLRSALKLTAFDRMPK